MSYRLPFLPQPSEPHRFLADDFLEWAISKRGRENLALVALTVACVAGIVIVGRYG
jgi:hypothetical protein